MAGPLDIDDDMQRLALRRARKHAAVHRRAALGKPDLLSLLPDADRG